MTGKKVEVLVFDDCCNAQVAIERARCAIAGAGAGVLAELRIVHIQDSKAAIRLRFLGSPTVRVDGMDVEPGALARLDYGLQCRMYSVHGQLQGAPPAEWIASALSGEACESEDAADRSSSEPRKSS